MVSKQGKATLTRHAFKGCVAAALVILISIGWGAASSRGQQPGDDVAGATILTRGPVHEAFAGMVTFNPEPGVVVPKAPPDVIEEMPPEERPEGDNVTWIPGYWAWDDERGDFLWVSGTWRALPPGRAWMAGYWGKTPQGYQWISGYWADAAAQETTYLPPPPTTVEVGPNIAAPSPDYGWSPGCWVWYQGRYAWRPGYWAQGRADWDWMPAHYVWTPRGCIFVGGYWDYSVERRGILFAPVYFESGVYSRRGYYYSPTIVIDLDVFSDHLFLRPSYHHYYFGDYYAASYYQGGFYASFSFQSGRHGYDPIYSHQRWEHRQDRDWEHRVEASYQNRRDHETARPPRTWAAQKNINPGTAESKQNHALMAMPIDQLAKRKDSPLHFQPVAKAERQTLTQRGQEVQKSRDERRTLEAKAVAPTALKPGAAAKPTQVQLPRSPIVSKPASQLGKNQAPPKAQPSPKPDPKFQPQSKTANRPPNVKQNNPQLQPRKLEPEQKPAPGRNEAVPAEKLVTPQSPPPAQGLKPKTQPGLEPRLQAPAVIAPVTAQPVGKPSIRPRPDPHEKGATKLMRKDTQKRAAESQTPRGNPSASEKTQPNAADKHPDPSPKN